MNKEMFFIILAASFSKNSRAGGHQYLIFTLLKHNIRGSDDIVLGGKDKGVEP